MSVLNVNKIVDASGGVFAPVSSVHKNRIINGAMVIDQRNAGASVTATASNFGVDRFFLISDAASKYSAQQNAGSVTPPTGFKYYQGITSLSAYSATSGQAFLCGQKIEGFNMADLDWGTANAKTVTLSFWVRSSLTGTFAGGLRGGNDRSFVFTYTISSANTWEYKTITIAGDTDVTTWNSTNGQGIRLGFDLGSHSDFNGTANAWQTGDDFRTSGSVNIVGTSGATWYITGVQLEVGTQATSFEYRQYQQELALCQRYCLRVGDGLTGVASSANVTYLGPSLTNPMRASPTTTLWDNSVKISDNFAADFTSSGSTLVESSLTAFGGRIAINGFTGLTQGRFYQAYGNSDGYVFILSAEL
jgi:hypothetical protein